MEFANDREGWFKYPSYSGWLLWLERRTSVSVPRNSRNADNRISQHTKRTAPVQLLRHGPIG